MTKQEVASFLERIKANYQSFLLEPYVLEEWYGWLKDYDKADVYKKFEEHLKGDYNSQIPKAHFITKFLTKSVDKGKTRNYKVICSNCKKVVFLTEYQKHMERHNSVEYMKLHKSVDQEKLMTLSDEEFSREYHSWITERCNTLMDKKDKTPEEYKEYQRLEKYIFSKPGHQLNLEM